MNMPRQTIKPPPIRSRLLFDNPIVASLRQVELFLVFASAVVFDPPGILVVRLTVRAIRPIDTVIRKDFRYTEAEKGVTCDLL